MKLKILLMELIRLLQTKLSILYSQTIYQSALAHLGTDASPGDRVDDVLGCAESVTEVLRKTIKSTPIITGTWTLDDYLNRSPLWKQVTVPMPGNVIISPTGTGNGSIRGHTGIVGIKGLIMSNDSYTGKWVAHYTLDAWRERYAKKGGFPVRFYTLT